NDAHRRLDPATADVQPLKLGNAGPLSRHLTLPAWRRILRFVQSLGKVPAEEPGRTDEPSEVFRADATPCQGDPRADPSAQPASRAPDRLRLRADQAGGGRARQ